MSELLEPEVLPEPEAPVEPLLLAPELPEPEVLVSVLVEPVAPVAPLEVEPVALPLPLMLPLAVPEAPDVDVSELVPDVLVSELLRVASRLQPAKPSVRAARAETNVTFN